MQLREATGLRQRGRGAVGSAAMPGTKMTFLQAGAAVRLLTFSWLAVTVTSAVAQGTLLERPLRLEQPAAATAQPSEKSRIAEELPAEPNSPRAALTQFFELTRSGRWEDAARFLALDSDQTRRGAMLARRLKGVIDDHHWVDLQSVSGAANGRQNDNLPADLEEVDRITVDAHQESVRMVRVIDSEGSHWAFSPATVARIDYWYSRLPDRWVRDATVYTGTDKVLLRTGPLELFLWQWAAIPLLLILSWMLATLLGKLSRTVLRKIVSATSKVWTLDVVRQIGAPLTLAWGLNLLWLGTRFLVLTEPANASVRSFAMAGMVFTLFWALWRSSGVIIHQLLNRPWATRSASARTLLTVGSNFARSAIFSLAYLPCWPPPAIPSGRC